MCDCDLKPRNIHLKGSVGAGLETGVGTDVGADVGADVGTGVGPDVGAETLKGVVGCVEK